MDEINLGPRLIPSLCAAGHADEISNRYKSLRLGSFVLTFGGRLTVNPLLNHFWTPCQIPVEQVGELATTRKRNCAGTFLDERSAWVARVEMSPVKNEELKLW